MRGGDAAAGLLATMGIGLVAVDPETKARLEREREEREAERSRKAEAVDPNEGRPLSRQQRRRLEKPWKKRKAKRGKS